MTPISGKKCTRFYIYKKQKKPLYINTKSQILFKKQENLRYVFIHKNPYTLRSTIFMIFLKLTFIYIYKSWHFALCNFFIYKKPDTSKKARNFALHYIYTKFSGTLQYVFFIELLKLAEGRGGHFYKQKNHVALDVYMQKSHVFTFFFYIQETRHSASHFYVKKNALWVMFLYLKLNV